MKSWFAFLCVLGCASALSGTNPLGPYKITDITTSGVSSGGFMATQVHVAFSATVNGSAVLAGVR